MDERYAQALEAARRAAVLQEHQFASSVPLVGGLIARFRRAWNNVSTRYYVTPVMLQQMAFNQRSVELLAQLGEAIERQARELRDQSESMELRTAQELAALAEANSELAALREELAQVQGWLVSQDRDQVALRHDLGELAVQLGPRPEAGAPTSLGGDE